ncbi:alpha/beta fold hydrolase [Bradyrhizobium sp. 31Argb]|uniref:alpha/beta hydrolase family protein n=1 Tax=unclassified Bradyrhizobium TaxID=2631580 RepID=UPI0032E443E3
MPLGTLAVPFSDPLEGVKDCPIAGTKLPLVIVSHGRGGWFGLHRDVAEALADAGFVVTAINHPGDNANDSSKRDTLALGQTRPEDMVRLLDFMLNDWKDKASIDPTRIGFFGFSFGGYTGLALAGAKPDFGRLAHFCTDKTGPCAQLHNGETPPNPPHDARIRAAVIADAPSAVFTQDNLAAIKIPLQFWRSERGGGGVDPSGTERVVGSLPGKPEIHVVPAGHYAFLPPCSPELAANLPRFCTDPEGFDRSAFHREFDASIVRFFREHLVGGTEAR